MIVATGKSKNMGPASGEGLLPASRHVKASHGKISRHTRQDLLLEQSYSFDNS